MTIEKQIEKLGPAFRGLWKSIIIPNNDVRWSVTFICRCEYVETRNYTTPQGALKAAIRHMEQKAFEDRQ
jgi:hypothetical protein